MPDTYSQITMHLVFAVKYREALILPDFRDLLFKYIYGIITGKNQKSLAVNGVQDHIHILFGMEPTLYIPEFVKVVKVESSNFVNENRLSKKKFQWQEGYAIFSHSNSNRDRVIRYILNQENHHREETFRTEYLNLLNTMEIKFDNRYVFDFFE